MLRHLVDRLRLVPSIDEIVLATTVNPADDILIEFARDAEIASYRGSEDDVMQRVIDAAASVKADLVVEITDDCPIIDPMIVEQVIRMYHANSCDYASNAHIRSYPDGMDVQVFPLDVLRRSASMTDDVLDHEHVTLHIRNHPELFKQCHLVAGPDCHWPDLGLTLDTREDLALLTKIIELFEPERRMFSCLDVVSLLRQRPDLIAINASVRRKGDS